MKPVLANINLKKSASIFAAAALLSLGSAQTTKAATIIEKIISPSDKQVSVNYVGSTDNSLVFHVKFENNTGEKFYLIIKNDAGDIVYQNAFTDAKFDKNIRIVKEENEMNPTFVIRTSTGTVERKFSVKTTVTENFVVTTL